MKLKKCILYQKKDAVCTIYRKKIKNENYGQ